jgi:antitoxin YefM
MRTLSYTEARQNFAAMMDSAISDFAPVLITRQKGESCILMSLKEYESMEETFYLLRSPANAKALLTSIEEINAGKTVTKSMEELERMEADGS